MIKDADLNICIVGLGYVGLPLAVEFGRIIPTMGYDINSARVRQLELGHDVTLETSDEELKASGKLCFTDQLEQCRDANIYIVTVPTPVDDFNNPDLSPLCRASADIGSLLTSGDVVIFESTVYPGATEEVCVPELQRVSGLRFNEDFFVGYSPERINPGDRVNRVTTILKITSGSTPAIADFVDQLYQKIITAGTHKTSSIQVAEAAKIIENTQRDVNIALMNELSLIFGRLGIDTLEVLEAAGTKWNFLPFRPGLVGGHCIGVDPFYLTHKAQEIGFHPQIISAARRINDDMGSYVCDQVVKLMIQKKLTVVDADILIMGLTFKENCPDIRNTRVIDVINGLRQYHARISVYDPWVNADEAQQEYDIELLQSPSINLYSAIIICVGHDEFKASGIEKIKSYGQPDCVIFDVKNLFEKEQVDGRL